MTKRYVLKNEMMVGGLNDTPFPDTRAENQATTQDHTSNKRDKSMQKVDGRLPKVQGFTSALTGMIIPPATIPLLSLDSTNNDIYIQWDVGGGSEADVTITLDEGDYFTYDALATELAAKLNADATVGGDTWTVDYDTTTSKKFTIKCVEHAIMFRWEHATSTLTDTDEKKAIWGFNFSLSVAANTAMTSDYEVDSEPPCVGDKRVVATTAKMYDEDKSEVYLADGSTSITSSPYKIAGVWANNKYYFSNNQKNCILRDRYLREAIPKDSAVLPYTMVQSWAPWTIIGVNQGAKTFTVAGDKTSECVLRARMRVTRSTGNDGEYIIVSSSYGAPNTTITVNEAIPDATVDGFIAIYKYAQFDASITNVSVTLDNGGTNPTICRIALGSQSATDHWHINYFSMRLKSTSSQAYDLNFYWIVPSIGYKKLFYTINGFDISTSATIRTDRGQFGVLPPTGIGAVYMLIEFESYSDESAGVEIHGTTGTSNIDKLDSDGAWEVISNSVAYLAVAVASRPYATVPGTKNVKLALGNTDGYIAELSVATEGTIIYDHQLKTTIALASIFNLDYDDIAVYNTEVEGTVYYELCRINRKLIDAAGTSLDLVHGLADATLLKQIEPDVTTSRRSDFVYQYATWWDNALWVAGAEVDDVVYYTDINPATLLPEPERFNLADNWIKIGRDGLKVTGLGGIADRLVVFKKNSFVLIRPSGDSYQLDNLNDDGIGTLSHWSIVPDFGTQGAVDYFQGQDGYPYVTDGVRLTNLGEGRLDVWVSNLNMAKLDQTYGILDPENRRIIWSVCTGSNTTPDKNLVYSIQHDAFYEEDYPADIWVKDTINSTYPGETLILGAKTIRTSNDIFYHDKANYDMVTDAVTVVTTGAAGSASFGVSGDVTADYPAATSIVCRGSTANDGAYTVKTGGATYSAPTTTVPVDEAISDNTVDGTLEYPIDATWETADLDFDNLEEVKQFLSAELSIYSETAGQTVTVYFYIDGSSTAVRTAGQELTLTTSPAKYRIPCPGKGKTIRFKIVNSDSLGWVRWNQLAIEYRPVVSLRAQRP
jgi:hypothetical protein